MDWEQNYRATSILLNNDNKYVKSWFKTFDSKQETQKAQKDEKLIFQKKLKEMQTYINTN